MIHSNGAYANMSGVDGKLNQGPIDRNMSSDRSYNSSSGHYTDSSRQNHKKGYNANSGHFGVSQGLDYTGIPFRKDNRSRQR